MTCIHCGGDTLTMRYALRCTPETRRPTTVRLRLCTGCVRQLCACPDIELSDESSFASAG